MPDIARATVTSRRVNPVRDPFLKNKAFLRKQKNGFVIPDLMHKPFSNGVNPVLELQIADFKISKSQILNPKFSILNFVFFT